MRARWWALFFGLYALAGCDDDPAIAGAEVEVPDVSADMPPADQGAPLDSAISADARIPTDGGPVDAVLDATRDMTIELGTPDGSGDLGVDGSPVDGGASDGGASDAMTDDTGLDGSPDSAFDDGVDAAADASPDGIPDAVPDATGDMTIELGTPDGSGDLGVDGSPVDGSPVDGGASDAMTDDTGLDGSPDSAFDDGVDAAADASPDGIPDAVPDLAPDMAWAPAVHRVFMTAEAFSADFGGLAGADAVCARAADAAGLGGTWKAILSDRQTAARDRLRIDGGVETTAGERVALDADDLWDGTIRAPIAVDARGDRFVGRPDVWTHTDADGRIDREGNSACSAWGAEDRPLGAVEIGRGDLTDARWISLYREGASAYGCGSQARLYCIDAQ